MNNSKNLQFAKFQKFAICQIRKKNLFGNFQKFVIWKIKKIYNLKNSKNFQFRKLQKFAMWHIRKTPNLNLKAFFNFEQIFKILQFGKLTKFHEFTV